MMRSHSGLLLSLLYLWTNLSSIGVGHNVKPNCGGTFTAARGILQTPNYPSPFATPIHCEWVIDRQLFDSSNASIVVYLTQLFLAEGLTFTEYQVYEKQFQFAGREVHKVDESNVARVRFVQTFQNYLVITLDLDTPHGVHLRVLDHFLDIYGFNITYEITTSGARLDACSMMDCGFTGTCYDHYNSFRCVCLPGYEGVHCSQGPSSYCHNSSPCRNGGTCIQIGAAAVKCVCPADFTGDACQTAVADVQITDCVDCLQTCEHENNAKTGCKCSSQNKVHESLLNDGIGLVLTMQLTNLPKLKNEPLKAFIVHQITDSLNLNHTRVKVVNPTRFSRGQASTETTVQLIVDRKDEKRTRLMLTKWAERGHIANLSLNSGSPFSVSTRTLLYLVSVSANVQGEVREGAEFILTCVARGSADLKFHWLKDRRLVNITRNVRNKWTRVIRDPHMPDQYTALLGISFVHELDDGIFTCQVNDGNEQQCRSYHVKVMSPPKPRIEPVSLTAHKGENFTVKCLCSGQFTYSWTKNHELIPVHTNSERYEILYPGGSLLQVFGIERDSVYSCLVQGQSGSAERSIAVSVVDSRVRTCPGEKVDKVLWPETAPDTTSLQECPRGYYSLGHASRSCILSSLQGPTWLPPDYSGCLQQSLQGHYLEFQKLYLGYSNSEVTDILGKFLRYAEETPNDSMLLGEGSGIIQVVSEIIIHMKKSTSPDIIRQSSIGFLEIVDELLSKQNSFVTLQQVESLQRSMKEIILSNSCLLNDTKSKFYRSCRNFDVHGMFLARDIHINGPVKSDKELYKLDVSPVFGQRAADFVLPNSTTIFAIYYQNISTFLPKRSTMNQNEVENEYEILNGTFAVWLDTQQPVEISALFHHDAIDSAMLETGWRLVCASADVATGGDVWRTDTCSTQTPNPTSTRCLCGEPGVIALLLVTDPDSPSSKPVRQLPYPVIVGCVLCLLMCTVATVYLLSHWLSRPSCLVFLKLQCCACGAVHNSLVAAAIVTEPLRDTFMAFTSAIACAVLLGLSSHLSVLLVVWTEVIPFKGRVSRPSVAAIATGLPILAVFANVLAHGTMDLEPASWWLQYNTMAFGIFTLSAVMICCLFAPLHVVLIRKVRKIQQLREKSVKINDKRGGLLQRSAGLFVLQVLTGASSVIFVNHVDQKWPQYFFCCCNVTLGVTILICYCIFPESKLKKIAKDKLKATDNQFFGADTGSPLNFFSKQETEAERDISRSDPIHSQMMPTFSADHRRPEHDAKHTTSFGGPREYVIGFEQAPAVQKTPTKVPPMERLSPDILGDIVEPSASAAAASSSEQERSQPDGRERDKLDGVLDSITHDLDYLLNRGEEEPDPAAAYVAAASKITVKSYPRNIEIIKEESEEDLKLPDSITDILRTSC